MKYSFLSSNISVIILGLIIGLLGGFKFANSQFRNAREKVMTSRILAASATVKGELPPETKALVEYADKNPQDIKAQMDAGDVLLKVTRVDESVKYFTRANTLAPDQPETLHNLIVANLVRSNWDEILKYALRYIELNHPQNDVAMLALAVAYANTDQKLDEAERLLTKVEENRKIDPTMIARAKADLKEAQSKAGNKSNSKSVLKHGPEESKK